MVPRFSRSPLRENVERTNPFSPPVAMRMSRQERMAFLSGVAEGDFDFLSLARRVLPQPSARTVLYNHGRTEIRKDLCPP